jgi:hypothetical protein
MRPAAAPERHGLKDHREDVLKSMHVAYGVPSAQRGRTQQIEVALKCTASETQRSLRNTVKCRKRDVTVG